MALSLGLVVMVAAYGSLLLGARFVSHLEMVAFFWWGVMYGYLRERPDPVDKRLLLLTGLVFTAFLFLGSRGVERTGTLVFAATLIMAAQRVPWGSCVTERLGDLSYGMYFFAFPAQQIMAALGAPRGWGFSTHLCLSLGVTSGLAYLSWHLLEKRVLAFKPKRLELA